MSCDRDRGRALLLSQGLFGAPAAQAERDRETRVAEMRSRVPAPSRDD